MGFGAVIVTTGAVSAFAYRGVLADQRAGEMVRHTNEVISNAADAQSALVNMETGYRGFLVTGRDEFLEPYNAGKTDYTQRLRELLRLTADNPAQCDRWREIEQQAAGWQREVTEVGIRLKRKSGEGGDNTEVLRLETSGLGKKRFDTIRQVFATAIQIERDLMDKRVAEARHARSDLLDVLIWGSLAAAAAAVGIATLLSQVITRPLKRCVEVLECTAKGDLSQRAEVHTHDELGRLARALNTATESIRAAKEAERTAAVRDRERADREAAAERERQEREAAVERERQEREAAAAAELRRKASTIQDTIRALAAGDFTATVPDLGTDDMGQMGRSLNEAVLSVRTAMEGVREVSEQLADASGQLSSASEEISSGAQEQASSLEETASSLQEITATVKQSADNAQQARQLASGSKEVAERGGAVVSGAVDAMSEINASSKKIADIITTIDEIAFQTNLLALNAAVEAARAGEQGRGFAVVATEVRNLAQRSATAAKEIKGLIQDSVKKVEAGTELVNKSGDTLAEIVTSVKRVTDIVTEMAAASREQSTGIEQVNKAVSQMDTVTQRNASQTEEMSATAQTLTDQAGQLRDLVGRFKLGSDGHAPAARPAKRSAPKPRPAVAKALKRSATGSGGGHELDAMGGDGFSDF
ncbi:methyl-accepting chemotaxis protein [Gemmata obscuriglobus]|uniref:methyl-accepting chemotaxis protein n=1 Tax=Gemmata obscuriglobus TaxID=114 RepID=UPI00016C38BA